MTEAAAAVPTSGGGALPVLVIGTAHVLDLAGPIRSVLAERPLDGIAIELDAERAPAVFGPPPAKGQRAHGPLIARLWAILQRRLGSELGAGVPGGEMRAAAAVAQERHLPLFLIDDPIRLVLPRLIAAMPFKERVTLVVGSVVGLFVPSRLVREQMEEYADRPGAVVEELRQASPTIARVLLDERNEHMAERLADLRAHGYTRIAVVVGDAHVSGLVAELERRSVAATALGFAELRRIKAPSSSRS